MSLGRKETVQEMSTRNTFEVLAQNLINLCPTFVKVLNEDFSSYLRISKENLGKAREAFSDREIMSIVGPNGKYDVSCKISRQAVTLEAGWVEFSKAHHLCYMDKLIFSCVGQGLLFVRIYDKNGKCIGNRSSPGGVEHKSDGGNDKEAQSQCKKPKVVPSSSRLPQNRKGPNKPSEVPSARPKVISISSHLSREKAAEKGQTSGVHKSNDKRKREISDSFDDISEDEMDDLPRTEVRIRKTFRSHRRAVTNVEQQMALKKAAKEFKSSRPHFLKQMKTTNVYRDFFLYIPTKFAISAKLPEKSSKISLRVPDRVEKWKVTCTFKVQNGKQKVWSIMGGWWRFSLDNNLEEGDALVFEMKNDNPTDAENQKIKINVHIFRVIKEIKLLEVL
ncbi:hypothetical protein LUZ61_013568 [Rhynchospora tenuis]|uniref:TF-B3 domain-containing protein n=1 Tax=Rhynchospora tenuis TaxID=198213 RepID=A0AAD5W9S6_9POAL|nr:hypothetical protein LUZ61_013568 [Rhynchospora tenuis]